ncbi:peptide-methionine (R)-S-oxide reductase MsrB [Candidatus Woesebacteria bacterium]|nr:peptide-methionine (R)-S-oxide reductase MsrB [Candidatus Woesebacteria bacterium]
MDSKTKEEKISNLTPEQFKITQECGTEAPFSGKYVYKTKDGMYECIVCGQILFSSSAQFDSGSGWPSFFDVVSKGNVKLKEDLTLGFPRTEVVCANCGAHLGHLFNDGPEEKTGLRYCINSAALNLKEK